MQTLIESPNLVKTAEGERSTMQWTCNSTSQPFGKNVSSSSSLDFTSDSRALDISPSLSHTLLAGLIGCQLWRRGRADQRRWEVKRMKGIQSIQNLHPNLVDTLRWCKRQPWGNFGEELNLDIIFFLSLSVPQILVIFNTGDSLVWENTASCEWTQVTCNSPHETSLFYFRIRYLETLQVCSICWLRSFRSGASEILCCVPVAGACGAVTQEKESRFLYFHLWLLFVSTCTAVCRR